MAGRVALRRRGAASITARSYAEKAQVARHAMRSFGRALRRSSSRKEVSSQHFLSTTSTSRRRRRCVEDLKTTTRAAGCRGILSSDHRHIPTRHADPQPVPLLSTLSRQSTTSKCSKCPDSSESLPFLPVAVRLQLTPSRCTTSLRATTQHKRPSGTLHV